MPNDMKAKASVFVRNPSILSQNYRRIEVIFTDLAVIATDRPTASPSKVGLLSAAESPNTPSDLAREHSQSALWTEIGSYD